MFIGNVFEERAYALPSAFRTPESRAAVMLLSSPVECAHFRQQSQPCLPYRRHTALKIVLRRKCAIHLSGFCDCVPYLLPHPSHISEANSEGKWAGVSVAVCFFQLFESAEPLRVLSSGIWLRLRIPLPNYSARSASTGSTAVVRRAGR
jgi:hypothetical protein